MLAALLPLLAPPALAAHSLGNNRSQRDHCFRLQELILPQSRAAGRALLSQGSHSQKQAGIAEAPRAPGAKPRLFGHLLAVEAADVGRPQIAAPHGLHKVILQSRSISMHQDALLRASSSATRWPSTRSSFTKEDLASLALRALRKPRMILRCLRFSDFQLVMCAFRISSWVGRSPMLISCSQKEENSLAGSNCEDRNSLRWCRAFTC
jgi:hypothetical protein